MPVSAIDFLSSDAFRQSLEFSDSFVNHETMQPHQLAEAVKTGGAKQFDPKHLPRIGVRLNKSGHFDAAKQVAEYHNSLTNPQQPSSPQPAPSQSPSRPNMPAYAGVLAPNRKKAVTDFVNHPNPDVQAHVATFGVHQPGVSKKHAMQQAEQAYDAWHAKHMGGQAASAPQEPKKPRRTKEQTQEIARRMGLVAPTGQGRYVEEPDMSWTQRAATPEELAEIRAQTAALPAEEIQRLKATDRPKQQPQETTQPSPKPVPAIPVTPAPAQQAMPVPQPVPINKFHMSAEHAQQLRGLREQHGSSVYVQPEGDMLHVTASGNRVLSIPRVDPAHPGAKSISMAPASPEENAALKSLSAAVSPPPIPQKPRSATPPPIPEQSQSTPVPEGRFARLVHAAKNGTLKTQIQNGLGNFFDKFDEHGSKFLNNLGLGEIAAPSSFEQPKDDSAQAAAKPRVTPPPINAQYHISPESAQLLRDMKAQHGNDFSVVPDADGLHAYANGKRLATVPRMDATNPRARKIVLAAPAQRFSRDPLDMALAELNSTIEFARKSDPRQMGMFAPEEVAAATAPTSRTKDLRKPARNQMSFTWDEEKHPRESTAHDGKRPGQFAKKDEPIKSGAKFTAKGNEIFDENGVRQAAFRNGEKASEAAERWNREGRPGSKSVDIATMFPSIAPFIETKKEEPKDAVETGKQSKNSQPEHQDGNASGQAAEASGSDRTERSTENPKEVVDRIEDFGEKLGGARKDTKYVSEQKAQEGAAQDKDEESKGWRKRYSIAQIVSSTDPSEKGKWSVTDTKDKTWYGKGTQKGVYDTKAEAEQMIPILEVARNHAVDNVGTAEKPNWAIVRRITPKKRPVIKDGFSSRDDAMKYMAQNAASVIEHKTRIDTSIHPLVEMVERTGKAHRTGNAKPDDFKDFGFRGVEFGNWNNSPERQKILNHAFDSMKDLASILGVPPKAISLDGELGLRFGSNGHGLTGATAHYERNYVAINLTKLRGAGALAHEWMHALDHWMGRLSGQASNEWTTNNRGDTTVKTTGEDTDYVSHGVRGRNPEFRSEVKHAIADVMDAINWRPMKYKEDTSLHEKRHKAMSENFERASKEFRESMLKDWSKEKYSRYKGKRANPADAETMRQVDELLEKLDKGDIGEDVHVPSSSSSRTSLGTYLPATIAKLSEIHKKHRGNAGYTKESGWSGTSLSGPLAQLMAAAKQKKTSLSRLADAQEQKEKTGKVRSEFYSEAEKMDHGTKGDYWSTNHEMAARAFESYIYDKLKERGGKDDFLAYEKHNNHFEYKLLGVKPYPELGGEERKRINESFDKLFKILSAHEMSGSRNATERPKPRVLPKDDGTWEGHWGSRGATPTQIASLKRSIGDREGVVHVNKKGSVATFYRKTDKWPHEKLLEHLKSKPGKTFVVSSDSPKEFSRRPMSKFSRAIHELENIAFSLS